MTCFRKNMYQGLKVMWQFFVNFTSKGLPKFCQFHKNIFFAATNIVFIFLFDQLYTTGNYYKALPIYNLSIIILT